jgi:translation initiation factor IF-3
MAIAAGTNANEHRINDRIRAREVRLVDVDSKQLGIKPLPEALSIARQRDLDLVEVAPDANPPVCRIMDYGKFKFDEAQRAKESRRKTTSSGIKEMKYRPKIGQGDFDTKTRQVARFLGEGHKVKITIMFRGREMSHPELGKKILDRVAEDVIELGKVEAAPKLDGRNMVMVMAPDKRAQTAKKAATTGTPAPAPTGHTTPDQAGTTETPNTDEGNTHEATTDEGNTDEGQTGESSAEEARTATTHDDEASPATIAASAGTHDRQDL